MPVQSLEPILASLPIFSGLDKPYLELLTGCAANVVFKDNDVLFREGEDANAFYVIREGQVALKLYVPGQGTVTIQTIDAGDVVGWSWLVPPHRWYFTAQAIGTTRAIS